MNKLHTGAKTDPLSRLKHKLRRLFRPKLGRAATPFNPTTDIPFIQNRFAKIGSVPIKNQGQSYSCGGQAGSYWLGVYFAITNGTTYEEESAKSIYAPIAYPGGGTTVGALEGQICNAGALTEAMLPSYRPSGTTDEMWMTDKSWMTPENLIIALKEAGFVPVTIGNSIAEIAEAIRDHIGVIWQINSDFYQYQNWISEYPQRTATSPEGHFMFSALIVEYLNLLATKSFQSWGDMVGDKGYQYFTEQTFIGSPDIKDVFTFVPKYVPHPLNPGQMIPNPLIITWQQRLINYITELWNGVFK